MADKEVLVTQQPPVYQYTTVRTYNSTGDHGMIFGVIASVIAFIIGGLLPLICTCSAIFVARSAKDDEFSGDHESAKTKTMYSYGLSIAGIVFSVIVCGVVVALYLTVLRNNNPYDEGY